MISAIISKRMMERTILVGIVFVILRQEIIEVMGIYYGEGKREKIIIVNKRISIMYS